MPQLRAAAERLRASRLCIRREMGECGGRTGKFFHPTHRDRTAAVSGTVGRRAGDLSVHDSQVTWREEIVVALRTALERWTSKLCFAIYRCSAILHDHEAYYAGC